MSNFFSNDPQDDTCASGNDDALDPQAEDTMSENESVLSAEHPTRGALLVHSWLKTGQHTR